MNSQDYQKPQVIVQERIHYKERFFLISANFWKGSIFGWLLLPWVMSALFNSAIANSPLKPLHDIWVSGSNLYNDAALGLNCKIREVKNGK